MTEGIAVIGLACRFPGARDIAEFWRNLVDGVDSVTRAAPRPVPGGSGEYVPARGLLTDPEWFDAGYFGFSPREARLVSPQHRVFLECAAAALDDAGHDPRRDPGAIGVYAGGTETGHGQLLRSARDLLPSVTDWEILIGSAADFMPSRVAYKLGLRGPAVAVQAACATSLVAVHTAVRALEAGDCDIALAGGAAVHYPARESPYSEGGIIARDGVCRSFDAAASGTVGGDGAGVVVLRRLSDALDDGDCVRAVIRGSAVNNDGADRLGYTAPGVAGQAGVIRQAQLAAGVRADEIGYVEAHGTATPLGDPIEVTALTRAFRQDTERRGYCRIGSVKSNIGHTDTAAGAAGLIKAVLAIEHGVIPPSLHVTEPSPRIDFASSPFRVVTQPEPWPAGEAGDGARRAGVSAFGIGGTNAHVVLEQAPPSAPRAPARPWQLLPLSARTPSALDAMTQHLADLLRSRPDLPVADVAWTLQVGRTEHPWRRFAIVADADDAAQVLTDGDSDRRVTAAQQAQDRPVAFAFTGTGDDDDAARLYRCEPAYRQAVDEVRQHGAQLRAGAEPSAAAEADLVSFARQYGMARLWAHWGIRPSAVCGAGVGALAAAAAAGALKLAGAVALVQEHAGGGTPGHQLERAIGQAGGCPAGVQVIAVADSTPFDGTDPAGWAAQFSSAAADPREALRRADAEWLVVDLGDGAGTPGQADAGGRGAPASVVPTLPRTGLGQPPAQLGALGRLWLAGCAIHWTGVHHEQPRSRVQLPGYPFERARFVIEGAEPAMTASEPPPSAQRRAAGPGPRDGGDEPGPLTVIRGLFAEILELPDVGPDDDFFDLGGDSLIAATLVARVSDRYRADLDTQALMDAPTPAALAALAAGAGAAPTR